MNDRRHPIPETGGVPLAVTDGQDAERDRILVLSDGRRLGFRCLGEPAGTPVFFFHGTPGSRFVVDQSDRLARLPGIRLIVPERPGYGLSDPKPGRTLRSWADDVEELADHLGVASFTVFGVSGGSAYALACAHDLAPRASQALIACAPAPPVHRDLVRHLALGNKLGFRFARYAPWLLRKAIHWTAGLFMKDPVRSVQSMATQMASADHELLQDTAFRDLVLRDMVEGYRQGAGGHADDAMQIMNADGWGFDPAMITVPVHLWHGVQDVLVTTAMADYLACLIPDCTAHFVAGAGHLLIDRPDVVEQVRRALLPVAAPAGAADPSANA